MGGLRHGPRLAELVGLSSHETRGDRALWVRLLETRARIETDMSDRPSLSSATITNLQAIHPSIPAEKLGSMFARTVVGGLFVLAGVGLVFLLVALPAWTAFRA